MDHSSMNAKVGAALQHRLQNARDYDALEVNIFLRGEPAADHLRQIGEAAAFDAAIPDSDPRAGIVAGIKESASAEQQGLIDFLSAPAPAQLDADGEAETAQTQLLDTSWSTNSVSAQVTPGILAQILQRDDVLHVELVRHVDVNELLDSAPAGVGAAPRPAAAAAPAQPTWSVKRINAPKLWRLGIAGKGILVAVIDTGVNYLHPDLKNQMWNGGRKYPKHGYDFASNDADPFDEAGHGTACAGIVAGNGAKGVKTGVAPQATVMALRVGGVENNFWKAFEFAIDQGVQVISMSMTWKYPSHPDYTGWRRACETLAAAGILHANSIGNQGDLLPSHPIPFNIATPGNCPPPRLHPLQLIMGGVTSAIGCGATDDTDQLAVYSGRGPAGWSAAPYTDYPYLSNPHPGQPGMGLIKPDVCAPGPGTSSCNWQYQDTASPGAKPYTGFGGTSAATPHVAGCLVLLANACRKANKPIVPSRIQEALEETAVRVKGQTQNKENHYGAGRVDVYAAYLYGRQRQWW